MKATDGTSPILPIAAEPLESDPGMPQAQNHEPFTSGDEGKLSEQALGTVTAKAYFQQKLGSPQSKSDPRRKDAAAPGVAYTGGKDDPRPDRQKAPQRPAYSRDKTSAPAERLGQLSEQLGGSPQVPPGSLSSDQEMKDAKATYEASRDVLDLTQGGRDAAQGQIGKAEQAVARFQNTFVRSMANSNAELHEIQAQYRSIAHSVADGKIPVDQVRPLLDGLEKHQKQVLAGLKTGEKLLGNVKNAVRDFGKINQALTSLSKTAQELKMCKGTVGQGLFAMDVLCNFADLQARDPNNLEKNREQAVMMSASKFLADVKTSGTPQNMVETAVGVMKFGLASLGMSETPAAKSLDAIASGMPIEMFSKNVGMLVDMAETFNKDRTSPGGALKEWERINHDNLAGNNGPMAQTGAMIGDLWATGGQNLPKKDMYGIADSLGLFGAGENIPDSFKRANTNAKALVIRDLMASNSGTLMPSAANENSLTMRELLTSGLPSQAAELLKKIDKDQLANTLSGNVQKGVLRAGGAPGDAGLPAKGHWSHPAGLVVDLIHKANAPSTPAGVRSDLMKQLGLFVDSLAQQGKRTAVGELQEMLKNNQLGNIPDSLRNRIQNAENWRN